MKVFFMINVGRRASALPPALLNEFRAAFEGAGVSVEIVECHDPGDCPDLLRRAEAEGFDTLFIGGGDGTIHSVLNVMTPGAFTLGVVPMGTVNAFARSFGIPLRPMAAVKVLLNDSQVVAMDVGRVNDRQFLCFASVGFDAAVVHDVALGKVKKLLGRLAFSFCTLRAVGRRARLVQFKVEGAGFEQQKGHSLVLSNVKNYAGVNLFSRARPDSGDMEMVVFGPKGLMPLARWAAVSMSRSGEAPTIAVKQFCVTGERLLIVQLDGEPVTLEHSERLEFETLPGAVRVLLPRAKR
ncbi:hypothetical protein CVU37_11955 [candidate division BRC1 bacterium HGW-BRC1-1]|nr:MAG: hypothetical protein CVU37_11955 [candidate division BRC1 bacterium HGW-BRC1-1]